MGTLYFHFKCGLANYVASLGLENWLDGGLFHQKKENRSTFWGER